MELTKIKQFENGIIEKIKSEKPEIIDVIQASGKLEENTEKLLIQKTNKEINNTYMYQNKK